MTRTDNRTNDPTPEQVEAAVHAAWAKSREFRGVGGQAEFGPPWEFQQVVRAALVAAQGAAPQAEELPKTGNELRDADGDLISSGKHLRVLHQGGYLCDTCTNSLGLNVRWDHAIKRDDYAPVLPSSGVDEDKLAEVIRKLRFDDAGCWADGIDCTESVSDHADEIARAVAEWLEDQGGGSRG